MSRQSLVVLLASLASPKSYMNSNKVICFDVRVWSHSVVFWSHLDPKIVSRYVLSICIIQVAVLVAVLLVIHPGQKPREFEHITSCIQLLNPGTGHHFYLSANVLTKF